MSNDNATLTACRPGDVFHFQWSDAEWAKEAYPSSLLHCFDGQLLAEERDGVIWLRDSYWGWGDSSGQIAPLTRWQERGTLTRVCNLDELESVSHDLSEYYDPADWFDLSYQHNCYKRYAVRKGAQRSAAQMIERGVYARERLKYRLESTQREIAQLDADLVKLRAGQTDGIYIPEVR